MKAPRSLRLSLACCGLADLSLKLQQGLMEVAAYHGVIGDGLIGVDPMLIWLVVWNHGIYFPIYWEYGGGFFYEDLPSGQRKLGSNTSELRMTFT
jgi:hypothetical protein